MASVGNARALESEAIQWQQIHQLSGSIVSVVPIKIRFAGYLGGHYRLVVACEDRQAKMPIKVDTYDKHACEVLNVQRIIFADASPKPRVEVRII